MLLLKTIGPKSIQNVLYLSIYLSVYLPLLAAAYAKFFAVRRKKHWFLSYPLSAQRRLWSDCLYAQAEMSLRWAHMSFCWFCRVAAQIVYKDFPPCARIVLPLLSFLAFWQSRFGRGELFQLLAIILQIGHGVAATFIFIFGRCAAILLLQIDEQVSLWYCNGTIKYACYTTCICK